MGNPGRLISRGFSVQDTGSMNPTPLMMADQHECPACGDQAQATGRRKPRVVYRCPCGLEFEVMTPGGDPARGVAPRRKATGSGKDCRPTSRSEASRSAPGPLASMLEKHRDGGRRRRPVPTRGHCRTSDPCPTSTGIDGGRSQAGRAGGVAVKKPTILVGLGQGGRLDSRSNWTPSGLFSKSRTASEP